VQHCLVYNPCSANKSNSSLDKAEANLVREGLSHLGSERGTICLPIRAQGFPWHSLLSAKTLEHRVDRSGSEVQGRYGNALIRSVNGLHEVERFGQLHRGEAIGLNAQP
jgi:hypothetical protein